MLREGYKTILITGSTSGIGLALLKEALLRGFKVYAGYRNTVPRKLLESFKHDHVEWLEIDVCKVASIEAAALRATDTDVLVNCAGIFERTDIFDKGSIDSIIREMDTNFFGIARMTVAFHKLLARRNFARIFNILSTTSIDPHPAVPGYSASKAAAFSFSESTRGRLDAFGILVTSVFVDITDTRMTKDIVAEKFAPSEVAVQILDNLESKAHTIAIGSQSEKLLATYLTS